MRREEKSTFGPRRGIAGGGARRAGRGGALLLVLLFIFAHAQGEWTTLRGGEPPADTGFLVDEFSGNVTATFLGDCTLGGEEKSRKSSLGYLRRIQENGTAFPMRYLKELTGTDDLTVANLEGVLTDRTLKKVEKKYNFSGPTAFTEILTSGGIDGVTLANNHSHDYGEEGYADTISALERAGIGWFGTGDTAVWSNGEGLKIGFIGVSFSLSGNRYTRYQRQMEALRSMGCAAVITVMHAGTEYSYEPDRNQRMIARRAIACGTDLVIGHHPHVVQGYEVIDGVPVVYSLGNCSFGGTTRAKDSDALAVQAEMIFEESRLQEVRLRFYPLSITSDPHYNNYSPRFLTGKDAERVFRKMKDSTGLDPSPQAGTAGTDAPAPDGAEEGDGGRT